MVRKINRGGKIYHRVKRFDKEKEADEFALELEAKNQDKSNLLNQI